MKIILHIFFTLVALLTCTNNLCAENNIQDIIASQKSAVKAARLDDAIDYGKIALSAYRNGLSDTLVWKALDIGGNACVSARRYIEALEFYMAAVEFGEKNHHARCKAIGLNNIGNIYEMFSDYERARHYYTKAYDTATTAKDKYMMGASLLNLVNVYSLLGDQENAEKYYKEQQKYPLHTSEETIFWGYISKIALDLANKNYDSAIKNCEKARETALANGFSQDLIALTYDRTGKAFAGYKMPDSVISYCRIIVDNPNAISLFPDLLVNSYRMLSDSYAATEMNDSANKYKLLYLHLSDSIFNRRKFNATRDLIDRYEDNEMQSHIFTLNDRIHFQNIWIIVVVCALMAALAIATIIHINNRRLQKTNELLISKNKDLLSQANESQRLREQLVRVYEQIEELKKNAAQAETTIESTAKLTSEPAPTPSTTSTLELSEQQLVILLRNITRIMQDQNIISDPSFSIVQLAQKVNSNTTYVSAAINQTYQKNFKTYLNEHRVQLAAQRLLENDTLTIQAIAESAGFKSASNFITAFKKVMGMNPSVYRKHSGFTTTDNTESKEN